MCTFPGASGGLRDESRRRRKGRPVAIRTDFRTEHLTELPGPGPTPSLRERGALLGRLGDENLERESTHVGLAPTKRLTTLGGATRTEQLGLLPRRPARTVRVQDPADVAEAVRRYCFTIRATHIIVSHDQQRQRRLVLARVAPM
jgi:hypothetical protein